jgi:ATP-binding cassette subfamily B protein
VIAHHLNTVRTADEIIVMEDGRLAQQGRHEDLIKDDEGAYARLWRAEESKHSGPAGEGAP